MSQTLSAAKPDAALSRFPAGRLGEPTRCDDLPAAFRVFAPDGARVHGAGPVLHLDAAGAVSTAGPYAVWPPPALARRTLGLFPLGGCLPPPPRLRLIEKCTHKNRTSQHQGPHDRRVRPLALLWKPFVQASLAWDSWGKARLETSWEVGDRPG